MAGFLVILVILAVLVVAVLAFPFLLLMMADYLEQRAARRSYRQGDNPILDWEEED